jgi:hypothetical protein
MTRLAGFSLLPTRSSRSKKVLLAGTMAGSNENEYKISSEWWGMTLGPRNYER